MADLGNSPILSDEENKTWSSNGGSQWDGANHSQLNIVCLKRNLLLHSRNPSLSSYPEEHNEEDQKLREIEADLIGFLDLGAKKPACSVPIVLTSDQLFRKSEKLAFVSGQKDSKLGCDQPSRRGAHLTVDRCCQQTRAGVNDSKRPSKDEATNNAASLNQQTAVNSRQRPRDIAPTEYLTPQFPGTRRFYPPLAKSPVPSYMTPVSRNHPAPLLTPVPLPVCVKPKPWIAPLKLPLTPRFIQPGFQYLRPSFS